MICIAGKGNKFTKHLRELAQKFYIAHHMALVAYPLANRQVKIFNKIIKCSLHKALYLYLTALWDN